MNSMSLKISSETLIKPLTHICNLSLTQWIFPSQLKIANVIPLYKSDDPMLFDNYRPVSVLCVLSKVCEKTRITEFQPSLKFKKKSSTHLALLSFIDKVIQAIEKGEYAINVFLDFSKAFDTADHDILLDKLGHYGIRGCALSWFKSYLSCRTQYKTYTGNESNRQMIKCGVPQGSILGPLLFLIYINDICTVCKNIIPVLFADDTNLFSSSVDATGLQDGVNYDLAVITKWLKVNKLSLNIKRGIICVVQQKKQNKIKPDISSNIDGQVIAEITSSKFLGVIIDDKLNWRDHVSFVCRKVARGLGVIIKVRKVLQKEYLISLYYSFIYPYLIYCNQIGGSTCKTQIEPCLFYKRPYELSLVFIPGHPRSPCFVNWSFWIVKISLNFLLVALCIEFIMAG